MVHLEEPRAGFDPMDPTRRDPQRRYAACWPSRRAMAAARQRTRELTPWHRLGLPVSAVIQDLNRFLTWWGAYFRYGNSTQQFKFLDRYVETRPCRFIARKHGKRGWRRGLAVLLDSYTHLGLRRLAGSMRYDFAKPEVNTPGEPS